MADYDLAIIGGGLNGVSLARDAAGRGLRVILFEQGDLGGAASSATSRLVHGDLAALERRGFLRVRAALAERDVWLDIAPHLVRPIRFAIPAHANERPPLWLRTGLWLYDRLAGRARLPGATTLDVTHHPVGDALKRPIGTAFEYSDCLVDDSRLVVLTALDATERGAEIRTGARCTRADRERVWRLAVIDRGHRRVLTARALASATGAWSASTAEAVLRQPPPRLTVRRVSQIVVPRLFDVDAVYVFQNSDGRLIFASPYMRVFTLIGSVAHPFVGDPAVVTAPAEDVVYLCTAANRYFRQQIQPVDVVRIIAGANMALPRRDPGDMAGVMSFSGGRGKAPLLTMSGGDVTTARRRAEQAISRLARVLPMGRRWTEAAPLPGGDFGWDQFDTKVEAARERWRFLSEIEAQRLVGAYGSRLTDVLGDAKTRDDLGQSFGPELTEAEVRYLMTKEWARFPDDVLWRRSKLGLTMPPEAREALAAFMAKASGAGHSATVSDCSGDSEVAKVEPRPRRR
ncbi:glycerol-3-phosphate dehydrogenase [Bradyrhizobium sp. STM 3557]|uniref:glycerol-3-phosphate dehydrogenase n=1 Tax=Bradyrhizobium sp. STM 3557 TaxID=578920 RepID=UPI00388E1DD3